MVWSEYIFVSNLLQYHFSWVTHFEFYLLFSNAFFEQLELTMIDSNHDKQIAPSQSIFKNTHDHVHIAVNSQRKTDSKHYFRRPHIPAMRVPFTTFATRLLIY